jgi:hypothetical protein
VLELVFFVAGLIVQQRVMTAFAVRAVPAIRSASSNKSAVPILRLNRAGGVQDPPHAECK